MVRFEHPFHHGSTRPINAAQVTAASVRSLKDEVASLRSQLEAERQAKADGSASRGAGSGPMLGLAEFGNIFQIFGVLVLGCIETKFRK